MVTARVGIETTRPPQFILELAERRATSTTAGAVSGATVRATPNEAQVVNEAAFGRQRENYAKDIESNPSLIQALAVADFHPTSEGLVRVERAVNRNAASWGTLVDAANTVTMTAGASPAANATLRQAKSDFVSTSGLRTTDTGDLAYMMARIMMKSDESEREDTLQRLNAALNAAEAQLKKLEQQRRDLDNETTVKAAEQSSDGKKDDGGESDTKVSAAETAARDQERAALDEQIANQRALVSDLSDQIDGMSANTEQGQSNQQLITEAILAMVEQAHAVTQMTAPAEKVQGTTTQNQGNGATT